MLRQSMCKCVGAEVAKWMKKIDFFLHSLLILFFFLFLRFFSGQLQVKSWTRWIYAHGEMSEQFFHSVVLCGALLCVCVHVNKTGNIDMAFLFVPSLLSWLHSQTRRERKNEIYWPPLRSDTYCKIYIHLTHFVRRQRRRRQQQQHRRWLLTVFQFALWSLLLRLSDFFLLFLAP